MRVSQLARKLNILPADVLAALPKEAVLEEGAYNARLTLAQVEEVVRFFRPAEWEKFMEELRLSAEEPEAIPVTSREHPISVPEPEVASQPQTSSQSLLDNKDSSAEAGPAAQPQEIEVIRAPKVELPGLRVVGKIEIPEKKKPEHAEQAKPEALLVNRPKRSRTQGYEKAVQRNQKNPIAVARERAKREAERERKKQAELQKKKKAERYQKKIAERRAMMANRSRPKVTTQESEVVTENISVSSSAEQLTWWQRFKKWLFRE